MRKAIILFLAVLLLLAVVLGAVLGVGNKCPEQINVRVYNEDTESNLLKNAAMVAVHGKEMTVEVRLTDEDFKVLLSYMPTPTPIITPIPTQSPTPISTPSPTPTPQYTGLRKWVEDNRYVTSEECTRSYLVKVVGQELCSNEVHYGRNFISILGQTFTNTGLLYARTNPERYQLI